MEAMTMTNVKLSLELAKWAEDLPEITALIKELDKEIVAAIAREANHAAKTEGEEADAIASKGGTDVGS
jgi:hypothetical protein